MKTTVFICTIFLTMGGFLYGQTMVGLTKEEVKVAVKKDHKEFRKDDSVIKQRFNYLKYVNGPRTKTWVIYFNDQDVCRTSKVICDYGDLNTLIDEINSKAEKKGEFLWEFMAGSDTITVELIKQEWYFTIRERKKQQAGE